MVYIALGERRGWMAMFDDDFDKPLGQSPVRKRPSFGKIFHLGVAAGGLGLLAALAILRFSSPPFPLASAGEAPRADPAGRPSQTMAASLVSAPARPWAKTPGETTSAFPAPPADGAKHAKAMTPDIDMAMDFSAAALEQHSGVRIIRPKGEGPPGTLIINVAKALNAEAISAPDPRLIEQTRYGPVPRIGPDGARPAEVYARPALSRPDQPRIALLISGMGLSSRSTDEAIATLPGAVTLGFAPYGVDLARQTARARKAGHELVLELPMESLNFPQDNPGPHTLVLDDGKSGNKDHLNWLMSRFTGYAGVANFLGGKFTADARALTPVLRMIAARGVFYLDDGSSARSLVMTLAPEQSLPAAQADVVLDVTVEPEAIETALARLESIARDKGLAIGVASALPVSIERVGRFARTLESRGISLVPLSAAMPNLHRSLLQQGLLQQGVLQKILGGHQP